MTTMQSVLRGMLMGGMLLVAAPLQALEDPTRPPEGAWQSSLPAEDKAAPWVLSSTLVSPQRRVAMINGQNVEQGDTIGAARVLRIDTTGVTLLANGEQIRIGLLPTDMKKARK